MYREDTMKKILSLMLIAIMALASLSAQKALVISNSGWSENFSSRPYVDALLVDFRLMQLGWDVTRHNDLDAKTFKESISKFAASIEEEEPVLVYFSGSAVQIDGSNYLLPTGKYESEDEFKKVAPELNWLLSEISKATVKMVFLDAYRRPDVLGFELKKEGMCPLEKVAINTLVMYGAPLDIFQREAGGLYSPLATALEKHIQTPELALHTIVDKIADHMAIASGGKTPPKPYSISTIVEGWKLNPLDDDEQEERILYRGMPTFKKGVDGGGSYSF